MNIKKWFISAVTLAFALGTAGAITVFAMTANDDEDNPETSNVVNTSGEVSDSLPTYDEWLSDFGDGKVVTSIDGIDPDVCDYIHNINACTAEELEKLGNLAAISWVVDPDNNVGDPTYDEWVSDHGDGKVVTSIDDIDPDVCNMVHNLNACTPQELEELGIAPTSGSIGIDPPGDYVESKPEPLFVDGEPQYEVQSHEDAVEQDCVLAGGTFSVSSDGLAGCVFVHGLGDNEEEDTQSQPPMVTPQEES